MTLPLTFSMTLPTPLPTPLNTTLPTPLPTTLRTTLRITQAQGRARLLANLGLALACCGLTAPSQAQDNKPLAEAGLPGFEASAWQGLVVPAATPGATVTALAQVQQQALASTPVKVGFQSLSLEALPGSPAQMAAYVRAERERWGKLIIDKGIKLD